MGIQISLPMMAFLVFMTGFAGFVDSAAGGGGLISLPAYLFAGLPPDRKSTRLNSSHYQQSRMPSSA